ncbi:MAG: cupin domain-containing protein [Bacteroidales bacterium]
MDSLTLIRNLHLQPHPEGGFYRETYRSGQLVSINGESNKNASTAIFFLLEDDEKSHFHRIPSDELWFFHQGTAIEIHAIINGELSSFLLGNNLEMGEVPQAVIPADTWFAAQIKNSKGYALVSCTVAPGFEFADFQLAKKEELMQKYPNLERIITEFTLY